MKKICLTLILLGSAMYLSAQTAKVIKFDELKTMMHPDKDKLMVINFWATWCVPCVKELPHFEEVASEKPDDISLILISLDFSEDALQVVNRFIKINDIKSPVYILDELDYNSWIDKVDKDWEGAIPATLFVDTSGRRKFVAKALTKTELQDHISKFITKTK